MKTVLVVFALVAVAYAGVDLELPGSVTCDSSTACPDGSTCCKTASGGWGCCPSVKATCCDDHVHCCPSEYPVCDTAHGQCKASSVYGVRAFSVPLLTKQPVITTVAQEEPELYGFAAVQAGINKDIAVAVAEGVLEGFAFELIPDLQECITSAEPLIADVDEGIKLLLKKTAEDVAKALEKFAAAIRKIAPTAKECGAAEHELVNLVEAVKAFESPKSFIYHVGKDLIVNHKQIFAGVNQAVVDYKQAQYKNFGIDLGKVLAEIVA